MRFCCCHKASVASEWWREPWLMTWSECVITWCWSAPVIEDVGDGLKLTEPPPLLLAPGDLGPPLPSSSFHLSIERRRAFMKKLPTVVGSRPSCLAIVTCISFDGLFVSLKIAWSVRRWRSVKTSRGFFGDGCSGAGGSSLRLQTANSTDSNSLLSRVISSIGGSPNGGVCCCA